jgi:hypothetical protein
MDLVPRLLGVALVALALAGRSHAVLADDMTPGSGGGSLYRLRFRLTPKVPICRRTAVPALGCWHKSSASKPAVWIFSRCDRIALGTSSSCCGVRPHLEAALNSNSSGSRCRLTPIQFASF